MMPTAKQLFCHRDQQTLQVYASFNVRRETVSGTLESCREDKIIPKEGLQILTEQIQSDTLI